MSVHYICLECIQELEDLREKEDRIDFWCNHCQRPFNLQKAFVLNDTTMEERRNENDRCK